MVRGDRFAAAGVLASAALVASHCLGAVLFVAFGTTLGVLGAVRVLEPYRPLFIAAGFGFWGYGFQRLYFRSAAGAEGAKRREPCENVGRAQAALWVCLCVLLLAIMLPTLASYLAG
ncbi:MAG: hypothetical protein HY271_09605 [Deltaproteobacteria bacterium]|nr:hypothetical protein [Deltaproteobacteria bacterium]